VPHLSSNAELPVQIPIVDGRDPPITETQSRPHPPGQFGGHPILQIVVVIIVITEKVPPFQFAGSISVVQTATGDRLEMQVPMD
jgi:hypothetical protein